MALTEILLSGGGTAGHLAPGFALRDALAVRGVSSRFVTPGEARERAWFPVGESEPLHVKAPRLPSRALPAAMFPLQMSGSIVAALAVLRRERPAAVVALGGWPCAPTALAAIVAGIPLALVAVDALPGVVVRRLSPWAGRVYLASDAARAHLARPEVARVVGPLVRVGAITGVRDPVRFGLDRGRRTLFVVGGSLGARGLNRAAVEGLRAAFASEPGLAARLQVIHSTGPGEQEEVRRAYAAMGLPASVSPYVQEMGDALASADLVLCRGGASTLAEVDALSRPAVVVPYPHHADRQQWRNAEPLLARGGAVLVEEAALTPSVFRAEVVARLLDPSALAAMSAAGTRHEPGRPDGAALAAEDLVRWMKEEGAGSSRAGVRRGSECAPPGARAAKSLLVRS